MESPEYFDAKGLETLTGTPAATWCYSRRTPRRPTSRASRPPRQHCEPRPGSADFFTVIGVGSDPQRVYGDAGVHWRRTSLSTSSRVSIAPTRPLGPRLTGCRAHSACNNRKAPTAAKDRTHDYGPTPLAA
jgi:hypothetical protein